MGLCYFFRFIGLSMPIVVFKEEALALLLWVIKEEDQGG